MPKISVIIPVYNTENYLCRCLDSVCNQTLEDIEIICIDDCSTDKSFEILSNYAYMDKRIRIISFEKNRGVSIARNTGIEEASGDYLSFVDSDDYIDLDFYEKLYNLAINNDTDVVKGNIYTLNTINNKLFLEDFYNMNDRIRKDSIYFLYGFTSAIYKTQFVKQYNINFPNNIKYFEDPYFSICVTLQTNKILTCDDAKYFYARRQDSAVGKCKTLENTINFTRSAKLILNKINYFDLTEEKYKIYFNFLLEQLFPWCWAVGLQDEANIVATQTIYDLCNIAKFNVVDLLSYHFLDKKYKERKALVQKLRRQVANAK